MSHDTAWAAFALGFAVSAGALAVLLLATFAAVTSGHGHHKVVDAVWGAGFALVAALGWALSAGEGDPTRRTLLAACTVLWGGRLCLHLARRARAAGEDPRYARMLDRAPGSRAWYALRMIYLLQGALILLVSLPVQAGQYVAAPPDAALWAGLGLWAVGLAFEAVGDRQLARFKADPANRGRVMDRGLWRYTRHPNYFGDFLVWWGLYLMSCATWPLAALALPAPLVMSFLLVFGSGKALLERQLAERPGYRAYMARTSGFLPLPPCPPQGD
ncbi:DUF1295 domain-containing protein [Streptomyces sp. DSM 44915]|uniref:DUF1295 domain-containing protein n=1 Tax=Streptomyces chisholmiae TaxID=3075540 RepID=A0ABU2JSL1_9ACTN|nr:DUF1295 domain-containing protein [Streptomyces sp. DSM 44915]MDT0267484.1 DUF1295 domain-containing protein [Streptomyces sp. DSM 44915]